jgi:hypothetical protein
MGLKFTYPSLVNAIQEYTLEGNSLSNSHFTSFLPTIIQVAEERIIRDLNLNVFDVEISGSLNNADPYVAIPPSYLGIRYFMISQDNASYIPLARKDITWLENYWRNPYAQGIPVYYAMFGNNGGYMAPSALKLAPTPNAPYEYKLRYIARPPSMSATNPETWLGDHAADCLLYACLAESMAYLREDLVSEAGMTATFETKYTRELVKLKQELSNQTITGFYF